MEKEKTKPTLQIIIIIFAGIILLLIFSLILKVSKNAPTGKIILYQGYENPNKNCIFKIDKETVSMYSCETKEDCINKIQDLRQQLSKVPKFNIEKFDIEILDCK